MADRESVVQVKFRLRRDVLKQVEKSAKASDRSLNEEIQRRVEQSFENETRSQEAFGSMLELIKAGAGFINFAEKQTGKKWMDDPATAALVIKAWKIAIETLAADELATPSLKLIAGALTDAGIEPGAFGIFKSGTKGGLS